MFYIIIFGLIIIIAAISLFIQSRREKETDRNLQEITERKGWQFVNESSTSYLEKYNHFDLFTTGHSNFASNILKANIEGTPIEVFEHHYTTTDKSYLSDNRRNTYHEKTVMHLSQKTLKLPQFVLQPQGSSESTTEGLLGIGNGSNRFSDQYLLQGRYEDQVKALFTPEIQNFFNKNSGFYVEGWNQELLVQVDKLEPGEIETFVERGMQIFKLLAQANKDLRT